MSDWFELAECRPELGHDPELWFPASDPRSLKGRQDRAEAKAICAGCPVRDACLRFALERGEDTGVWGGLDEAERRAVRRRRIAAIPPPGALPRAA
jgi:WhiB family redox-sensing transcriptional regulator